MQNLSRENLETFYSLFIEDISLSDFEKWIYSNSDLEKSLSADIYHDLISFNYKSDSSKDRFYKLIFTNLLDVNDFEKWKIIRLLRNSLNNKNLPVNLMLMYELYCKGYDFLHNLGLGYGLTLKVPISTKLKKDNWWDLTENEKIELLESFQPDLNNQIEHLLEEINSGEILFNGRLNEDYIYEYKS